MLKGAFSLRLKRSAVFTALRLWQAVPNFWSGERESSGRKCLNFRRRYR